MSGRKVLMTGHRGYIGSVMAPYLMAQGYDVVGLDCGFFNLCTLVPDPVGIPEIRKDVRDLVLDDVRPFYAIVHLAALSNDPVGDLQPEWTQAINYRSSVRLAELAREAGVRRLLFSSSCIMYGMSSAEVVTEESPLDPKTEYARSKVRCEVEISAMANDDFSPTFLRNGTVYGVSPRMRFDTVLNDLAGAALTTGRVVVHSDGKPWRPVVHVEDIARSFHAVLEAPEENIHNQAFNNGADYLNCQVFELAEIVADLVPGTKIDILAQPSADQRTYRADFSKFARAFGSFEFRWTPGSGAAQVVQTFRRIGLTYDHYVDKRFNRLRWLTYLRETKQVDDSLRWAPVARGLR